MEFGKYPASLEFLGKDLTYRSPVYGERSFSQADDTEGPIANALMTDAGRNALDIGMQSTTADYALHPNQAAPNRLGHVADIAALVITIGRRLNLDEDYILAVACEVALGDLAHGPFSHLTDQAVEGVGGAEKFHDMRANNLLVLGGVYAALRLRMESGWPTIPGGYNRINIPPWAECDDNGMNVDRLQYTGYETVMKYTGMTTQAARDFLEQFRAVCQVESFSIIGGKLVFNNKPDALLFAKGYLLLSESWNSRLKRAADSLLIMGMKSTIVQRQIPGIERIDHGGLHFPPDYLYGNDLLMSAALQNPDAPPDLALVDKMLKRFSTDGQRAFSDHANDYLTFLLDPRSTDYPDLSNQDAYTRLHVAPIDNPDDVVVPAEGLLLRAPKYRYIDPLVKTSKGVMSLSDIKKHDGSENEFAQLLRQHRRIYSRHWLGILALGKEEQQGLAQLKAHAAWFDDLAQQGRRGAELLLSHADWPADWPTYWQNAPYRPGMTDEEIATFIEMGAAEATENALRTRRMVLGDQTIRIAHSI